MKLSCLQNLNQRIDKTDFSLDTLSQKTLPHTADCQIIKANNLTSIQIKQTQFTTFIKFQIKTNWKMLFLVRQCYRWKIQLINCSSFEIVKTYSFVANEKRSSFEQKYMRTVLEKNAGCVLFNPSNHLNQLPTHKLSIDQNQLTSKLTSVVTKINERKLSNTSRLDREYLVPLNAECLQNYKKWSINTQLYVLDIWHFLHGARKIPCMKVMLTDLFSKFADLETGPILQLMYYVAISKREFSEQETIAVTKKFDEIFNKLMFDEISVYCLALTKSKCEVTNEKIVKSLYDLLSKTDLQKCNNIGVIGILKAVRRYSTTVHIHELKSLQNQLIPYAKEVNWLALTNIIRMGTKQRVFNEQLIQIILRRLLKNIDKLRIKEIERSAFTISMFNDKSNSIQMEFLETVQKHLLLSLDTNFPFSLMRCISYLAICDVVDTKLIDWALDKEIHVSTYGAATSDENHALLLIDSYAKINLQNSYNGNKLPNHLIDQMMPKMSVMEKRGKRSELGNEVSDILHKNGAHCIECQVAPYVLFPDLVLVYNKRTNKTVKSLQKNPPGTILNASDLTNSNQDLEAVAIIPCLQRHTVFESNRYTGHFQLRINQFKMLGFKTIVIRRSIWQLYQTDEAKRRYLALEFCKNNIFLFNHHRNISFKSKKL